MLSNSSEVKLSKDEKLALKKEKNRINKEHYDMLRENPSNKRSIWLNIVAFFIPVLGLFWYFYYLLKCPNRSKSLFRTIIISLIFQIGFIILCYLFLFEFLGNICITLFG